MRRLWDRLKAWWELKRHGTVSLPGFFLPEQHCIFCGKRFEIQAADFSPGHRLIKHGCPDCDCHNWVEV